MDSVTEARENLNKALRACTKSAIPSTKEKTVPLGDAESSHSHSLCPRCAADGREQIADLSAYDLSNGGASARAIAAGIVNNVETRFSSAIAELITSEHMWSCERIQSKERVRVELMESADGKVASMSAKILGTKRVGMCGHDCLTCDNDLQDNRDVGNAIVTKGLKKQRQKPQSGIADQKCRIESSVFKAHSTNVQMMTASGKVVTSTAKEYLWLHAAVTRLRHDLAIALCNCRIALMSAAVEVAKIEKFSDYENRCSYLGCTRLDQESTGQVADTRRRGKDNVIIDASRETSDYIDLQTLARSSAALKLRSINKGFQEVKEKVDLGVIRAHNFRCRLSHGASSIARLLVAAVAELRTVPISCPETSNTNRDEAAFMVSWIAVNPEHTRSHILHNVKAIASWLRCNNIETENKLRLLRHLVKCVHAYRVSVCHVTDKSNTLHSSALAVLRCGRRVKAQPEFAHERSSY
mmetsp:Transcript_21471/g.66234  ORF Transcript_21471/g.66234 Transcript_21471/m.66234 type:complete len:469 (-) Transcript_21471:224-1630(-)